MRKAKPRRFGQRDPIVYESTNYEIRKQSGKPSVEIRSRRVVRLPFPLVLLILASIMFLPEESRAFASTAANYLLDFARDWILRPSL